MLVRLREREPKAVIGIARYDVHMKVGHILKRNLAVGDEQVHASRPKRVAHELAQPPRDAKRAHRGGFVEVGHEDRVLTRHDEHVAVRDRLNIHERDHAVVLVRKAGGRLAPHDLAEHTLAAQFDQKLNRTFRNPSRFELRSAPAEPEAHSPRWLRPQPRSERMPDLSRWSGAWPRR